MGGATARLGLGGKACKEEGIWCGDEPEEAAGQLLREICLSSAARGVLLEK